jgi:hypothetical protein
MKEHVIALILTYHQILGGIVPGIGVDVVNDRAFGQRMAEGRLRHGDMLFHIP